MSLVHFFREFLSSSFPYVDKQKLEALGLLVSKGLATLSRLKTFEPNTFNQDNEIKLKQLQAIQHISQILSPIIKEKPLHLIQYLLDNPNIDNKILITFYADYIEDLLALETEPLSVVCSMEFNSPAHFAATIVALLRRNISIPQIVASGLLQDYFALNYSFITEVTEVYRLLSLIDASDSAYEDCQACIRKADSLSLRDFMIREYQLNGVNYCTLSGKIEQQTPMVFTDDLDPAWQERVKYCTGYIYVNEKLYIRNVNQDCLLKETNPDFINIFLDEIRPGVDFNHVSLLLRPSETDRLEELLGTKTFIILNRPRFKYSTSIQNFTNLYQLFGIAFLKKVLSSTYNQELLKNFFNDLTIEEIKLIYQNIFTQTTERDGATLVEQLTSFFSEEKLLELVLPISSISWLVISNQKDLLEKMTPQQLDSLVAVPLTKKNLFYVINSVHRLEPSYQDPVYFNFFQFLLMHPEDDAYFSIIDRLHAYAGTKGWCKELNDNLKNQLLAMIEENAEPFTYDSCITIYTFFCQNITKIKTIKRFGAAVTFPQNTLELYTEILNYIYNKNPEQCSLSNYLEAIHPKHRYDYSEDELNQLKLDTLCSCIENTENLSLKRDIASFLINNFEKIQWLKTFSNKTLNQILTAETLKKILSKKFSPDTLDLVIDLVHLPIVGGLSKHEFLHCIVKTLLKYPELITYERILLVKYYVGGASYFEEELSLLYDKLIIFIKQNSTSFTAEELKKIINYYDQFQPISLIFEKLAVELNEPFTLFRDINEFHAKIIEILFLQHSELNLLEVAGVIRSSYPDFDLMLTLRICLVASIDESIQKRIISVLADIYHYKTWWAHPSSLTEFCMLEAAKVYSNLNVFKLFLQQYPHHNFWDILFRIIAEDKILIFYEYMLKNHAFDLLLKTDEHGKTFFHIFFNKILLLRALNKLSSDQFEKALTITSRDDINLLDRLYQIDLCELITLNNALKEVLFKKLMEKSPPGYLFLQPKDMDTKLKWLEIFNHDQRLQLLRLKDLEGNTFLHLDNPDTFYSDIELNFHLSKKETLRLLYEKNRFGVPAIHSLFNIYPIQKIRSLLMLCKNQGRGLLYVKNFQGETLFHLAALLDSYQFENLLQLLPQHRRLWHILNNKNLHQQSVLYYVLAYNSEPSELLKGILSNLREEHQLKIISAVFNLQSINFNSAPVLEVFKTTLLTIYASQLETSLTFFKPNRIDIKQPLSLRIKDCSTISELRIIFNELSYPYSAPAINSMIFPLALGNS